MILLPLQSERVSKVTVISLSPSLFLPPIHSLSTLLFLSLSHPYGWYLDATEYWVCTFSREEDQGDGRR